jgi:spore coat polysaccharide biosynthesis protein SpsF
METAAIIQARMGSSRLPGKVMMEVLGKPLLQHLIERVSRSDYTDDVIVATEPNSKEIINLCNKINCECFVGDENNVFKRVLDCAFHYKVNNIIEITGDCPLADPCHIDELMYPYDENYISNCFKRSWPDGADIQIYSTSMLLKTLPINPSHVGWNIKTAINTKRDLWVNWEMEHAPERYNHPYWGLTLDEKEDFEVIKIIFEHFGHNEFTFEEVMEFLFRNPQVLAINHHIKRKEPGEG